MVQISARYIYVKCNINASKKWSRILVPGPGHWSWLLFLPSIVVLVPYTGLWWGANMWWLKTMLDKIILEQFCTQEREDLPGPSWSPQEALTWQQALVAGSCSWCNWVYEHGSSGTHKAMCNAVHHLKVWDLLPDVGDRDCQPERCLLFSSHLYKWT